MDEPLMLRMPPNTNAFCRVPSKPPRLKAYYEDDGLRIAALEAGAREYVLKHEISDLPEIVLSLAEQDEKIG
jgi:hypothetical protein